MKLLTDGLPIKASFVTRSGFHKHIDINKMDQMISLPFFTGISSVIQNTNEISPDISVNTIRFMLMRYKIVHQNKGLKHIIAVYEEA